MRERIGKVFILQNYDYSVVRTRVLMEVRSGMHTDKTEVRTLFKL